MRLIKKLHLCFDLSYFHFWIRKILISSLKHFLSLHLLSYLHLKIYDCQHFQHTVHEYFWKWYKKKLMHSNCCIESRRKAESSYLKHTNYTHWNIYIIQHKSLIRQQFMITRDFIFMFKVASNLLFCDFDVFHLKFLAYIEIKFISCCGFSERTNFLDFKILKTASVNLIEDENEQSENEEYENFEIGSSPAVDIFLKNFLCKRCVTMMFLRILAVNFSWSFVNEI